ncbi:hypothetical protein [Hymenobacter cellulosilyticus]|uniref:Outer membrane protein beta-barrel domain-containing protein n=1 Tax=Hymenobacter cellulosilyticus TaxID=2932248 RepID=A0A8T9Q098_9BACT|nr:hypothetical protein [Hymenobacter cellulosilyticus]UOQ70787.1 hypothetical protein MUN79_19130 [Hymenobacter cellulosilyticus]
MKRILITLALVGAGMAAAPAALAQTDTTRTTQKPQLNTAPPGSAPRPAQPTQRPAVPVPAPPPVDEPLPAQRNPNSPSGLEFPKGSRASEQPKPLKKYFLYTNVGLGYSSYAGQGQFNVSLAPAIGYRVNEKFSIGPGVSYSYNSLSYSEDYRNYMRTLAQVEYPKRVLSNNVGVKVFAQYMVVGSFFAHLEYEVTRTMLKAEYDTQTSQLNRTLNTPLAGAGYRSMLGDRMAADIVVLYNFNDGIDSQGFRTSPYGQPEIRFNFLYNLSK